MNSLLHLVRSTIGRKYLVALTGVVLVGFVIVHMAGNLQIFGGPDLINHYGHVLQSNKILLWTARLGLLAAVGVHIWGAISLAVENKQARPQAYQKKNTIQATLASLTMVISGTVILAFIIFHILHFTTKDIDPSYRDLRVQIGNEGPLVPDVYGMMVKGFSNPYISAFYIISVGFLCFHLSHGVGSIFQSMGWRTRRSAPLTDFLAKAVAIVVFLGMAGVPVAVLLKVVN